MNSSISPNRRALLRGAAAAALATSLPVGGAAAAGPRGTGTSRLTLPSGLQTGDVTSRSAVLWSRASGEGRLHAVLHALDADGERLTGGGYRRGRGGGRDGSPITLRGPWATAETDFTARISADGLPAGTAFETELFFEDEHGRRSEVGTGQFRTAPGHRSDGAQTFVWTADTAGQGYGINPDVGGMFGYETMRSLAPDFFLHAERHHLRGRSDRRNARGARRCAVAQPLVTDEVTKVAETLEEFRGRHRYNLMDDNIRAMYAEVPVIATWDDHETTNNWWAGSCSRTTATRCAM